LLDALRRHRFTNASAPRAEALRLTPPVAVLPLNQPHRRSISLPKTSIQPAFSSTFRISWR
jgi:hypothetical protein